MKWLKNTIKSALTEFVRENNIQIGKTAVEHCILSKEHPNLLTIDVGQMPTGKAKEYMSRIAEDLNKSYPGYRFFLIAKWR